MDVIYASIHNTIYVTHVSPHRRFLCYIHESIADDSCSICSVSLAKRTSNYPYTYPPKTNPQSHRTTRNRTRSHRHKARTTPANPKSRYIDTTYYRPAFRYSNYCRNRAVNRPGTIWWPIIWCDVSATISRSKRSRVKWVKINLLCARFLYNSGASKLCGFFVE